jgi:hypothetical protein
MCIRSGAYALIGRLSLMKLPSEKAEQRKDEQREPKNNPAHFTPKLGSAT